MAGEMKSKATHEWERKKNPKNQRTQKIENREQ